MKRWIALSIFSWLGFTWANAQCSVLLEDDMSLDWEELDQEWYNKQRVFDNDKNGDNALSREEVRLGDATLSYFRLEEHFSDADRNSNGNLSVDELRTFNPHETWWVIQRHVAPLDSVCGILPFVDFPDSTLHLQHADIFQKLLGNPYWVTHHYEYTSRLMENPNWNISHPKEVKALLGNRMWLAQNPDAAQSFYVATEAIWKRDAVLSRWIRRHQAFITEFHQ